MVAARARSYYDEQAKQRMSKGGGDRRPGVENLPPPITDQGKARDAVGTSGQNVQKSTPPA
jgi:hypothetical protein